MPSKYPIAVVTLVRSSSIDVYSSTVRALDEWANARSHHLPLSALKGAAIGIHASHYLDQHLNQHVTKEPLLGALGGFPFALKANIERELENLRGLGVTLLFVFDGLEVGKPVSDVAVRAQTARAFGQAWELYDSGHADQVVDAFSNAGTILVAKHGYNGIN